jgi:hypothetical protein
MWATEQESGLNHGQQMSQIRVSLRNFYIGPVVRKLVNKDIPDPDHLAWIQVILICYAFPGRAEEQG